MSSIENGHALATVEHALPQMVTGVEAVRAAMAELRAIRTFVKEEMVEGLDYGKPFAAKEGDPNVKDCLLQPGAQKIAMLFNAYPEPEIKTTELGDGHVEHVITVRHINRASRQPIGCGIGSCSTKESKYRYRNANRKCPKCGAEAIIAGREEYGGGWLCFKKKGGCGEKFPIEWPAIASQIAGRVENPDIADMRNTVLKMALKRSLVSASLGLGCVSDLFTQDLEEQGTYDLGNGAPTSPVPAKPESPPTKAPRKPKEKPAAARASTPPAEAPDPTEPTEWGPWAAKRCETFNARWTFEVREKGYPAIEELTNPMNVWRMNYALATRAVREQKIPEMPTGFKRQDWAGRELATLWKQDQPWVRAAAKAYLIERQGEFRAKAQAGAAEAAKAKPAREPGEDEDDDADILY